MLSQNFGNSLVFLWTNPTSISEFIVYFFKKISQPKLKQQKENLKVFANIYITPDYFKNKEG